jgi:hypothetical protein
MNTSARRLVSQFDIIDISLTMTKATAFWTSVCHS